MITIKNLHNQPLSHLWQNFFNQEQSQPYFKELLEKLSDEIIKYPIYPEPQQILRAFELCPLEELKVVILGQDPYTSKGQANGLAFSVVRGEKIPPSLKTIYKELNLEYGFDVPSHGDLSDWARQGVLMFNSVFSVRQGECLSHKKLGYLTLTDHIIDHLIARSSPIVFMLWGNYAQSFVTKKVVPPHHLVIKTAHPSPLANGKFYHTNCFKEANLFLEKNHKNAINWQIV